MSKGNFKERSRCKRELPQDKFGVSNREKGKLQRWCKECYQEYYREHKEPKGDGRMGENGKKDIPELGEIINLSQLLRVLPMGHLLFLSLYLRQQDTGLSQVMEIELTKRIYESSEYAGEDIILSLLETGSLINHRIIPDLYEIRDLADMLLEETGANRESPSVEDFLNRIIWEPISNYLEDINN